jgi:hypothetical protein
MRSEACLVSLAGRIAGLFATLPQAEAVALGGSHIAGIADPASDIDLYVYTRADIPLIERQKIVDRSGGASRASLGLTFWGPGDEWVDAATGMEVDIVYFDVQWMESQIDRVVREHRASLGYSTCFWFTVLHSQAFHDPRAWFQALQRQSRQDYPEALRRNIIGLNHAVLRNVIPSYANQLAKAAKRRDWVSVTHRLSALLASYFDVIFALNRVLHPGEKRLIDQALARCKLLPVNMASDIETVIRSAASADQGCVPQVTTLLDRLDQLLEQEGFDPCTSQPA